jgi:hypothetical protein
MVKGSAAAALPFSTIDGDYVVGGLELLWMLSNSFACLSRVTRLGEISPFGLLSKSQVSFWVKNGLF